VHHRRAPGVDSSSSAGRTLMRSRARVRTVCCSRPSVWRMIWARSGRATRRMRPIVSRAGCATAAGSAARLTPYTPPEVPEGKVNLTDPDSKPIPVGFGFVQGYAAQTAVNEQHVVVAAEITNKSTDFSQLLPMVEAIIRDSSGRVSSSHRRRSPPMPATGTSATSTRSSPTSTSRGWSPPTRAAAAPRARRGPDPATTSCARS
jgi:hypothetical protein